MIEEFQYILNDVDKERIYQHIIKMEGPRFPLDNMDELNEAAGYITEELESYGAKVITHEFIIDELRETFKNIEAHIGDESQPALIVSSHYDTVENCPGANDNLSGVAICLEIARLLSQAQNTPHIIINFFTLEEIHPGVAKILRETAIKYHVKDENMHFTKVKYVEQHHTMVHMMVKSRSKGSTLANGVQEFIKKFKEKLDIEERRYYNEVYGVYEPFTNETAFGKLALIGSNYWVENAIKRGIAIKGAINIDTVGIIKQSRFTQSFPPVPRLLLRLHKTNYRNKVANFTLIGADKNSKDLFRAFLKIAKNNLIDLPFVGLRLPLTYPKIAKLLPDMLRADHAPFWRQNIPALFLTDTAGLRWDGYHTKSDESQYLNYETISKICKAVIAAILTI